MGRKLTLKITEKKKEKVIKVREFLTINNLKAVIEGALKHKTESIDIIHEGKEITGHKKLVDLGLEDGHIIEINGSQL